mgnify:CR=1 FL=1
MRKKFFIILNIFIFLINSAFIVGQNTIQDTSWNKIIIYDAYFGWTHFNNELQIKKENYLLTSQQNTDSIVKKINPDVISELIQLLKQKPDTTFFKNPLQHFGKDSLWLVANAKPLWKEFSKYQKKNKEIDSFAIKTIKDLEKVNTVARSLQGSHWTDDYPLLAIGIIKEKDTLTVLSNGQYPYMLPLIIKSEKVYNARISELISQLLPDSEKTNRERIKGTDFNNYLISAINRFYIERKSNYLEAKKKYPQSFKAIEKKFQIENVEIVDMASIEWGNDWGKIGLEMELKDSVFSNNIQFYTISGKSRLLHSQQKIVHKKDKLLQLLQNNPIFQLSFCFFDSFFDIKFCELQLSPLFIGLKNPKIELINSLFQFV